MGNSKAHWHVRGGFTCATELTGALGKTIRTARESRPRVGAQLLSELDVYKTGLTRLNQRCWRSSFPRGGVRFHVCTRGAQFVYLDSHPTPSYSRDERQPDAAVPGFKVRHNQNHRQVSPDSEEPIV